MNHIYLSLKESLSFVRNLTNIDVQHYSDTTRLGHIKLPTPGVGLVLPVETLRAINILLTSCLDTPEIADLLHKDINIRDDIVTIVKNMYLFDKHNIGSTNDTPEWLAENHFNALNMLSSLVKHGILTMTSNKQTIDTLAYLFAKSKSGLFREDNVSELFSTFDPGNKLELKNELLSLILDFYINNIQSSANKKDTNILSRLSSIVHVLSSDLSFLVAPSELHEKLLYAVMYDTPHDSRYSLSDFSSGLVDMNMAVYKNSNHYNPNAQTYNPKDVLLEQIKTYYPSTYSAVITSIELTGADILSTYRIHKMSIPDLQLPLLNTNFEV